MACHLFGTKPLSEPMMTYCQLDPKENISMNYYLKFKVFIQQNAFENIIWEMADILFQSQCVNKKYFCNHFAQELDMRFGPCEDFSEIHR